MSKYENIIRKISLYMVNHEYDKARHHIKRIWNHIDEMTNIESYVLRELACVAFNKN